MSGLQDTNSKPSSKVEILKWPLRVAKAIFKLPAHISKIYEHDKLLEHLEPRLDSRLDDMAEHLNLLDSRLVTLESKIASLSYTPGKKQDTPSKDRFADSHDLDSFYVGFEDRFRGTEEEIRQKVSIYPKYFQDAALDYAKYPVIDIGCGRGELLGVLTQANVNAIGIDINFEMVDRAQKNGFNAVCEDAMEYLRRRPANSVGGVTGMHLIEHLPFDELLHFYRECYRVLVPGGLAIFETPNPENVSVGSFSFYMDPSHLNPLPPQLTEFALESVGFVKPEILRLHPGKKPRGKTEGKLMQDMQAKLYGPRDYAIIVKKPGMQ